MGSIIRMVMANASRWTGVGLLACGLLILGLQAALLVLTHRYDLSSGEGLYCGLVLLLTGLVALKEKNPSRCLATTLLVLGILSSLCGLELTVLSLRTITQAALDVGTVPQVA